MPAARFARLVGLPVGSRNDIEAGEPAGFSEHPSVDADGVSDVVWLAGLLRCMSADHDLSVLMWRWVAKTFPV